MILVSNKRAFHSRISLSGTERKEGKIKVEPDNWIHERSYNFHNTRYPLSESGMDPEKKRPVRGDLSIHFWHVTISPTTRITYIFALYDV